MSRRPDGRKARDNPQAFGVGDEVFSGGSLAAAFSPFTAAAVGTKADFSGAAAAAASPFTAAAVGTFTGAASSIIDVDLSALTLGEYTQANFATATGLAIARAAGTTTVQTSASTLVSGIATNSACIGDRATGSRGLVIQPRTINGISVDPRDPSAMPNAGAGVTYTDSGQNGPDGTSSRTRIQLNGNSYSKYFSLTPTGTNAKWSASQWARSYDGGDNGGFYWDPSAVGAPTQNMCTTSTTWQRVDNATLPNTVCDSLTYYVPSDSETAYFADHGAQDFIIDFMQLTKGDYPVEAIGAASGVRGTDVLTLTSGSSLITGGRVRIYQKFIPKFASTKTVYYNNADHGTAATNWYLWSANGDGTVYARLNSSKKVELKVGILGVTSNEVVAWSQYDVVEFYIEAGDTLDNPVCKYAINGGAYTTLTWVTPIALGNISISGAMRFFGDDQESTLGSGTMPIWVQQITAWADDGHH